MLASIVHILPLTTIRRERALPVPGRVLVRQGQKVEPRTVVAEGTVTPEHLLLDVPQALGISAKEARGLLQREVGDMISEDDLIAGPVGITRRVVRAPVSGQIALIRGGKVLLEVDTPQYQLRSGMDGVVIDLIAERGAVIESVGALVQGVWGNGKLGFGLLQNQLQTPGDKLTPSDLDVSLRGTIVLGGFCNTPDVLQAAADIPIKGLILSSMAASLVSIAAKMPYPIVVLRGFGEQPLDSASYKLLTSNQNREASLNAAPFNSFRGTRPEVIIPLPASSNPSLPPDTKDFASGQRVRITHSKELHAIGTIQYIAAQHTVLPNGLRAPAASIQLESGETTLVPLANLEILT